MTDEEVVPRAPREGRGGADPEDVHCDGGKRRNGQIKPVGGKQSMRNAKYAK